MLTKNNAYLVGSLAVLLITLVILLFVGNRESKISVDKSLFRVADQTKISRVVLKTGDEQINLKFDGTKWLVNDSLEADKQLIKVFFATLLQAEPKRPVAKRQLDSVNQKINSAGTKVDLYEEENLVKSFFVAGNTRKTETYYKLENDPQPYIVTVPGYKVYVGGIFELTAQDWRDKRIFNFNWQNFKQLSANFPASPADDFKISFQDGFFGIEGNTQADTTKLNDYLDAVSLIQASRFIPLEEKERFDSLFRQKPDYTIQVSDIANRSISLSVYNVPVNNLYIPALWNGREGVLLDLQEVQRIGLKKGDFKPEK